MLIDALKTAGGGTWFRVVERQGIDHLVRERQIIRSARDEAAKKLGVDSEGVGPLLFAGIIIEGGVIGYDTNVKTGGRGARYLGICRTKQYREEIIGSKNIISLNDMKKRKNYRALCESNLFGTRNLWNCCCKSRVF